MNEIFVAGDIHGNYQGLMESLNAAGWQEGDTIICVGDVTDRGKDNARTVSFLQEHECDVRLVQGNHELQHRKMLQYYHVLIKVPQIRLFAAGIFRTYKEGYTYPKTKEELKEYECSADKRIEIIQGKPKTFHAFVRAFIAYTLAWEDDSLWKIILYLLEVMCGNPYNAERTIYEYLSCTRKQRALFEWLWNQTATEVNIDYTEPYKYQHIVITHNNPFGRYYSYDPDEVRSGHDKTLYIFGHIPHSEIVRFDRDCSGCTYLDIDTSLNSVGVIKLSDYL